MSIFFLVAALATLLPGYVLTLLFLPSVRGVTARLGFALAGGLALDVVAATLVAYAGLPVVPWTFFVLALVTIGGGWWARRNLSVIIDEWRRASGRELLFLVVAILFAVGAASLVAAVHEDYPWPIHADEWWGVGTAQNLLEGQGVNSHPYFFTFFANDKPGFTSYTAFLAGSAGVDPVAAWAHLPAANMFFAALLAALFFFSATKNPYVALLAPVALASLRSNAYTLGWWFFVSSMFALTFLVPLLLSVPVWCRKAREAWWGVLLFVALGFVYLPLALLWLVAMFPLVVGVVHRWRLFAWLTAGVVALTVVVGALASPYRVYWGFPAVPAVPAFLTPLVHAFFVPVGGTIHFAVSKDPFIVVSVPILILAAFGLWEVWRRERWAAALGITALLALANVAFIGWGNVSFLLFHERALYFFGFVAALVAPLGAWGVARFAKRRAGSVAQGTVVLLVMGLAAAAFAHYRDIPVGTALYYPVTASDLPAMEWLKNRKEFSGMTVVADPVPGTVLTPLTRLVSKVSLLTQQSANSFDASGAIVPLDISDCARKEEFLIRMNADLVYTAARQSCAFLTEAYQSPGVFIYLTAKGRTALESENAEIPHG